MSNVSPRWALGGALVLVTRGYEERVNEDDVRGGLGAVVRVRRWLGGAVGLDVSAGLWGLRGVRPTVEVGVEVGGLAGLTAGARGDRLWPRRGEAYVGVRCASGAALAAGIVGLLRGLASLGGT